MVERALDSLKANITKATKTLVKHLDSERDNISIRAAEDIIEFTQKTLEHEELEKRIEVLEAKLSRFGRKSPRQQPACAGELNRCSIGLRHAGIALATIRRAGAATWTTCCRRSRKSYE